MSFIFNKCYTQGEKRQEIQGLYEVFPKLFPDARGYFFESYNEKDFIKGGIECKFVQDNQSKSSSGVLRGLHFQKQNAQAKLVRALEGVVFDVAVDLRNDSKTFGNYYGVLLDASKNNQFFIPRGFAHGFYVLSETATFAYKCDSFYAPGDEGAVLFSDETIAIPWDSIANSSPSFSSSSLTFSPLLSDKDKAAPLFDANKLYFNLKGKWIGD